MRRILTLIFSCVAFVSFCQNIVPNPDFANFSSCPNFLADFGVNNWSVPTFGTSDYYNACSNGDVGVPTNIVGFQQSDAGDAYCGLVTYQQAGQYREYIQAILDQPTIANACYKLSIYYNPADQAGFSSGLGMLLSNGAPGTYIGQSPQLVKTDLVESNDTWHVLSMDYISPGGETHVTIGNFYTDANTDFTQNQSGAFGFFGYYLIDSVAVEFQGESSQNVVVDIGEDLEVCADEFPITIISSNAEATNIWNTGEIANSIVVNEAGTYYVDAFLNCEFNSDTIKIEIYDTPEINIDNTNLCFGEQLEITLDPLLGTYSWSGGVTGNSFSVSESGNYTVDLTYECGVITEDFTVNQILPIVLNEQEDLFLCLDELPTIVDYGSFNDGINEFLWQDGSTGQALFITGAGEYSLEVYNECFSDNISFEVFVDNDFPAFVPFDDTIACPGEGKLIYLGFEGVEYLWQDNSTLPFYAALEPGEFSVTVSNLCKTEIFEFEIVEAEEISLNIGQDIELCPGDSVFLSAENGLEIGWSTGENSSGIWVSDEGEIIASVEGFCDVVFDTVNISFNGQSPQLNLPDSLLLCEGDTLNLSAIDDPSGIGFEWSTGDNTNEISIIEGGNYIVGGINNCGVSVDSVYVSIGESLNDPNLNDTYEICEGDSLNLSIISGTGTVEWSTGIQDSFITIFDEGFYFVEIENSCTIKTDSFEINFLSNLIPLDLGADLGICQGDSISLIAPEIQGDYTWSTNQFSNSIVVNNPGVYSLNIQGACNSVVDSIEILDLGTSPNVDLGPDLTFCSGDSLELAIDVDDSTIILWNTGSQDSSIIVKDEGEYNVIASNLCDLSFDTINVNINNDTPIIDLGEDLALCFGDTVLLDIGNIPGEILWNTGSQEPSILVDNPGTFSVSLSSSCGESNDTIQVEFNNPPAEVNLKDTIKNCFTDIYEVNLSVADDVSILWSTGSTDTFEIFFFDGAYSVELSNSCGAITDSFVIENYPFIESFNLGDNLLICNEESIELNSGITQEGISISWNTGDVLPTIIADQDGLYWVEASNECYVFVDSIEIEFDTSPIEVDLGQDDTVCSSETILLDGFIGDDYMYEWQDGLENSIYNATESGDYIISVSNECGVSTDSISLIFLNQEEVENPLDSFYTICEGTPLLIDLVNIVAEDILWNDGSKDSIRELNNPGIYSITFINSCFENTFEFIFEQQNCGDATIYVPNIFTPNFDNNNDVFNVFFPSEWEINEFELQIYNRWGERVFVSTENDVGWDGTWKGKTLNPAVFVYIMEATVELDTGEIQSFSLTGDITIVK